MKNKLANIVTTSTKIKFDLPINRCKTIDDVDKSLPTLIIGYEMAKKSIDNFNILEKHTKETNIYWTFKRNERGVDYEDDLKAFYKIVVLDFCDGVKYQLLDFYRLNITMVKKLITFAKSDDEKLIYVENNRFLYVYCEKYKMVFGFSLSTAKFFGIKPSKIVNLFKNNVNNRFISDFSIIPYDIKYIIGEKIDKYLALYDYFTK